MKVSLRLAELLKDSARRRRGLVAEISGTAQIDRHTVSAMLNNTVEYINLDAMGRLCDYLVKYHDVDERRLPGALLGRDPDKLWDMLASCQQLHFCLGTRRSPEWPGAEFVMATDSRLQGLMLSKLSQVPDPIHDSHSTEAAHRLRSEFHLVPSPPREAPADPYSQWSATREKAKSLYADLQQQNGSACLFLGTTKVNPATEITLARTWGAEPFACQDDVRSPKDRACPFFFRYREQDPKPESCCGGMRLARRTPAPRPGLYYEKEDGSWDECACDPAASDAAFIFFAYHPSVARVEVACGGFSSRATDCMTKSLDEIVGRIHGPQYTSRTLDVGVYIVRFSFDSEAAEFDPERDNRPFKTEVIGLSPEVIRRRLAPRQQP